MNQELEWLKGTLTEDHYESNVTRTLVRNYAPSQRLLLKQP